MVFNYIKSYIILYYPFDFKAPFPSASLVDLSLRSKFVLNKNTITKQNRNIIINKQVRVLLCFLITGVPSLHISVFFKISLLAFNESTFYNNKRLSRGTNSFHMLEIYCYMLSSINSGIHNNILTVYVYE